MNKIIDLNSDLGEGFGAYSIGDDKSMLDIVTSANVACGFHGGDPEIMSTTFRLAKERGVAIGAHPGFQDLWGFGRRVIPHSLGEIERLVAYQIGAAQALATHAGHAITYVKAHGALGNLALANADVAGAITRAMKAVDSRLICVAIALGQQVRVAREAGLEVISEIYADRAYTETGALVSRQQEGAVLHDPDVAAARVVRMIQAGAIETVSGKNLATPIQSICVHSDTPAAIAIARRVRQELEAAGVTLRHFSSMAK